MEATGAMTRCIQAMRFVIGLAMLVGGVAVLAPLVGDVLCQPGPAADADHGPPPRDLPPLATSHAIPDPRLDSAAITVPHHEGPGADHGAAAPPAAAPPAAAYQPPTPPPSLPPQPAALVRSAPPLGETYRSTLAVPPPPLLDAHGPPPLAPGWTTRSSQRPISQAQAASASVPATYAVRDGDDLTSLAIRFYGHPAAAAALLAANRDHITDPDILPIGVRLRLPPPWTITAGRTAAESRAIEPGPGIDRSPAAQPTGFTPRPTQATQPWLDPL
jgi:phage tail protein X